VSEQTEQATEQQTEQAAEDSVLRAFETGKVPGEETEPEKPEETQQEASEETTEAPQGQNEQFEANARLERQNRELQERLKQYEGIEDLDTTEALRRLGKDPMDFLMELDDTPAPQEPADEVRAEVQKLKDLVQRQQEELQKTRIDSFVEFKRREIADEARRQAESYPFANKAIVTDPTFMDSIMSYAVGQARETGAMPDAQSILKAADTHVVSAFMKNLESFLDAPGGAGKVQEALAKVQQSEQPQTQETSQASDTLKNEMSADQSRQTNPDLTDEEAEAAFLKAMRESGWVGD
jgi:hypothetical protein